NSTNRTSNTRIQTRQQRLRRQKLESAFDQHLKFLYAQLYEFQQQQRLPSTKVVHNHDYEEKLQTLFNKYQLDCLRRNAHYKIENERINKRYDNEIKQSQQAYLIKKYEVKELLLDRFKRKRKLLEQDKHSIDIHSKNFDYKTRPIIEGNSINTKAYNFRQRQTQSSTLSSIPFLFPLTTDQQDTGSGHSPPLTQDSSITLELMTLPTTSTTNTSLSLLGTVPRKKLVGAFNLFSLPKWTIKDQDCDDDLKSIKAKF
ncbi:unnamed protein product, partial [Didymodactylos carnosus]